MKNMVSYSSDEKKKKYYLDHWNKVCEEAGIGKDDPDYSFMEILVDEMSDTERNKSIYKLSWNREEYFVIFFAFLNAVVTGVLPISDNEIITIILSISGVIISALIAAINSYKMLKSTKEAWLRCSLYRAKLSLEADDFCDNNGNYKVIEDPKEKISYFREAIKELRVEDYSNFFVNIGSNFDYVDSDKKEK